MISRYLVFIYWEYNDRNLVKTVTVGDLEKEAQPELPCSSGAVYTNWGDIPELTPEFVFREFMADGFASEDERLRAIREFSKIEGFDVGSRFLGASA